MSQATRRHTKSHACYAIITMAYPKAINGVESNPYSAPPAPVLDLRPRLKAIVQQFSLATIFTLIFALSFFFLAAAVGSGFPFALRYTRFIVLQCPDVILPVALSYAVLRQMMLGPIPLQYLWLPVLRGVASFHVYQSCWSYCYTLICASLPPEWTDMIPATLLSCVPALFGVVIERCLHALFLIVIHRKQTEMA